MKYLFFFLKIISPSIKQQIYYTRILSDCKHKYLMQTKSNHEETEGDHLQKYHSDKTPLCLASHLKLLEEQ